ncbi:MAG: efflux RND transporter periplasmic adaptor subunit [Bacteroidaceae bacterium]|nr:efflux RND transporter periplasmic adaptor subunit [Bacteroidaceae bacterium]
MKKSLLFLLLLFLFSSCQHGHEPAAVSRLEGRIGQAIAARRGTHPEPVQVDVTTVRPAAGGQLNRYVGRVEPARSTLVTLPHGGTLVSLRVREGQRVGRGDILAEVKNEALQAAYDMAASTLRQAEDGFARVEKVYDSGSITEQKYMEVKTQLEKARSSEQAARSALDECIVRAPYAATVSEVLAHQGTQVSPLAPLVRLVDVGRMEVTFAVPEGELASLHVGDSATVTVPAIAASFPAVLTVKGVMGSALSHSYDCTLGGLPEVDGLMPGMICKVGVAMGGAADGVLLPASAVMTDREGRYVWTADSVGIVGKRHITVDGFSGHDVVVTSGLKAGERVIVNGSQKVSTGMKVKLELKR